MTRLVFSRDWRDFFGDDPYPFDMAQVESRDGAGVPVAFVAATIGPPPQRVLDLGCGYGRHMAALAAAGHGVHGTDVSHAAVARAQARAGRGTAVMADNERLPFRAATFDAAICLYTSFGYVGTSARGVFSEAARVVRPGGYLVVDTVNGGRRPFSIGWERVPGGVGIWLRYGTREVVRQRNLALTRRVVGVYGLSYRRYVADTLAEEIGHDGRWAVKAVNGDFDGSPQSPGSPRILVVACRT